MNYPPVYINDHGYTYGVFCEVGKKLALGIDFDNETCCNAVGCLCQWEEGQLRKASSAESKQFYDSLKSMADEAYFGTHHF